MGLAELFAEAARESHSGPPILPEAAIMRLREFAEQYHQPNPFKVGDLVTPRPDADLKGAGIPHIVVEVRDHAEPLFIGDNGDASFGRKIEIRIAHIDSGRGIVFTHWAESHRFEPYTLPAA